MVTRVLLTRTARKQLRRVPRFIAVKLQAWVDAVEAQGLEEVRKIPGFHDEPLYGKRRGQRSIRLSRSYRAIYEIRDDGAVEFARIEEVVKHDY
jgi:proteic killer suppression protein